jgi:hypothetical protein
VAVLIGDPAAAVTSLRFSTHDTIPLVPPGQPLPTAVAPRIGRFNARHWTVSPTEFIPQILSAAGITSSDARIFISYRTTESQKLCDQLFDALNHAGFDVFVDRFRIAVGADFQQRILEELAQKAMVLFLESAGILKSPWTRYEASVAKSSRLGILSLLVPGGVKIPDVDATRRVDVTTGWKPRHKCLDDSTLAAVVERIRSDHAFHDSRRRQLLRDSMRRALARKGVTQQQLNPDGTIEVNSHGKTFLLWLPPRPGELSDFHHVATAPTSAATTPVRAIFAPASHMVGRRREQIRWLSLASGVGLFDESQIAVKALDIARGNSL